MTQWKITRRTVAPLYVAIALCLITVWALGQFQDLSGRPVVRPDLSTFPEQVDAWTGAEATLDPDAVAVLGLDDWLLRRYENESGQPAWLYVGYLENWRASRRRQAHHSPRFCYPAQGWRIVEEDIQPVRLADGTQFQASRLLVQKGRARQLVIYWFQWGNRISAEEPGYDLQAKATWLLRLPEQLIENRRTDRALIRISAPVYGSPEQTLARQRAFLQAVFPLLQKQFADGA